MIDPMLLATLRVSTFDGDTPLTAGTGFFFARGERIFLVTSRHVLVDAATGHHPNRITVVVHLDPVDLTRTETVSVWLYKDGRSLWRQAEDSGGEIDVAVIELDRASLPGVHALHAFSDAHLQGPLDEVPLGAALLVVGFPLGFFDTLHNLPVARHAIVASAFGVRFQGQGYFLTDARMHRGASGAPVVLHAPGQPGSLPWKLLGIHSARLDMLTREQGVDETLGLNCAWYADILRTLTQ
ncbi:MAG TPA: serine protease [Ramlibacter sp.]|jgi:S1-C subfamily serine protease|uniref:S1 family peptidase n=1 Tax=Ramlibacter sp. TaxID=1917967 RepID=UPI002D378509|nr:serine protease [Ramlibacter sp.]HZY19208.1 serine protease [Ramlibacter sp.]